MVSEMGARQYKKAKFVSSKKPIEPCHDWKELSSGFEGWCAVRYLKCKLCGMKAKYYGQGNIIIAIEQDD